MAKTSFTLQQRDTLLLAYNGACACCAYSDVAMLECDHVIPESQNGPTTIDNAQILCHACNNRKGERTVKFDVKKQDLNLTIAEIKKTRRAAWAALGWNLEEEFVVKVKRKRTIHRS